MMSTSSNRPKKIYLDSDNRISGTHDDFELELPTTVVGCKGMEPISVTIPLTCYPIPEYERDLFFIAGPPLAYAGVVCRTRINHNRNYSNIQELVDELNHAMINNTQRMDLNNEFVNGGVTFSFNPTTRKIEFTCTGSILFVGYKESEYTGFVEIGPSIRPPGFVNLPTDPKPYFHNLAFRLGFANEFTGAVAYSSTIGYENFNPGKHVFPSILRTTCIYVSCSLCMSDSMTSSANGNRDLLVKVPVTSADAVLGSLVNYQNQMKDQTMESIPMTFKRIRIRLLDEEQMPLGIAPVGKGTVSVELRCFYE